MSDIAAVVAFVNARLGEEEATAKCALMWQQKGHAVFVAHYGAEWGAIDDYDPKQELRDVQAKRAILAEHELAVTRLEVTPFDPSTGEPRKPEWDVECARCGWVSSDPTSGCPTLLHLAAIWPDHPDYKETWKP